MSTILIANSGPTTRPPNATIFVSLCNRVASAEKQSEQSAQRIPFILFAVMEIPKGCSDDTFPWDREGEPLDTKYLYVAHSELNAILNYSGGSLAGAKLYVSLFPCNECAKAIIQCGIKEVIYDSDKYANTPATIASKRMMEAAGVNYRQYRRTGREISFTI